MNTALVKVLMGLSALVIALSILFNIGNSQYIDRCLITPAAIIFGAGMIALAILSSKPKD